MKTPTFVATSSPRGMRWFQSRQGKVLLVLALVASVLIVNAFLDVRSLMSDLLLAVDRLGVWAPLLFVGLYIVATVLLVPGLVLTVAAGTLFGLGWGTVYVSLASTVGATCAFLIGRYLARDWIAAKVAGHPRFAALDRAVEEGGWKIVGLTRLSPLFPFNLLNYAFGLTKVRVREYVTASWVGMLPGTIMYVYFGSLGAAAVVPEKRTPAQWALFGLGLLATVWVTVMITRSARKALAAKTGDAHDHNLQSERSQIHEKN